MAPPVFKTGLAAIAVAGGFDSLPLPPEFSIQFVSCCEETMTLCRRMYPLSRPFGEVLGTEANRRPK